MATTNQHTIVDNIKKFRIMVYGPLDACRYEADEIEPESGMPIEQPADILTSKTEYIKDRIVSHALAARNLATVATSYINGLGEAKVKAAFDAVTPGHNESVAVILNEFSAVINHANQVLSDTGKATGKESLAVVKTYLDANVDAYESPRRLWAILESKEVVK